MELEVGNDERNTDTVISATTMLALARYLGINRLESRTRLNEKLTKIRAAVSERQRKQTELPDDDIYQLHSDSSNDEDSLAKRLHVRSPLQSTTINSTLRPAAKVEYKRSVRRPWTPDEVHKLKLAIQDLGEGNWMEIKLRYRFDRSNVDLKDKWRNLKKSGMV